MENSTVRLNGETAPKWLRITGVTFPVLNEITHNESSIPKRHGNLDSGVELGGKSIELSVVLELDKETNLQDRAQQLKRWLKGDGWQSLSKFTFTESEDYYYNVRPTNTVNLSDLFFAGEGTITLRSSDGIRYRNGNKTHTATGKEFMIEYQGDEQTPLEIELEPLEDTDEIRVTHNRTGRTLSIGGHFKKGVKVGLYNGRKILKIDGTTDMTRVNLSNKWLYLLNGDNLFTIESSGDVDFNITAEYKERY